MFGKKVTKVTKVKPTEEVKPDLVVEQPETMGMPGFVKDPEPPKVEEMPAPTPEPAKPAEQYQIVEVGLPASEGLYVYKIVTNKYLGELGGVYEA